MKNKNKKCFYSKCVCPDSVLTDDNPEVHGSKWYHKKCWRTKQAVTEVKDIYYTYVSKNVVMAALVKTINNIVFVKGVDPEFLVFALKYAIRSGREIKSPYYLHYLAADPVIKAVYAKKQAKKLAKEIKSLVIKI